MGYYVKVNYSKKKKNNESTNFIFINRFVKIGDDDEEQLNFKDALLMWVKNKVAGYNNVSIDSFKKSFSDGMALCALIHKHRPKLINFDSLNKDEPLKNLKIAMTAAEKF